MKLTLIEGLLKNLRQQIPPYMRREYLTQEAAYELLKKTTGADFGLDAEKWEAWVRDQEATGLTFKVNGPTKS